MTCIIWKQSQSDNKEARSLNAVLVRNYPASHLNKLEKQFFLQNFKIREHPGRDSGFSLRKSLAKNTDHSTQALTYKTVK